MIDDDDDADFIELDEFGDAPPDALARTGVLMVPGVAVNNAAFAAEGSFFKVVDGPGSLVMFVDCDDDGRETTVSNLDEFQALGYRGADDSASLTRWLALTPGNAERDAAKAAAILAARGDL